MQFFKKPIAVEAFQLPAPGDPGMDAFHEWAQQVSLTWEAEGDGDILVYNHSSEEAPLSATTDDWIVAELDGRFRVYTPQMFEATHAQNQACRIPGPNTILTLDLRNLEGAKPVTQTYLRRVASQAMKKIEWGVPAEGLQDDECYELLAVAGHPTWKETCRLLLPGYKARVIAMPVYKRKSIVRVSKNQVAPRTQVIDTLHDLWLEPLEGEWEPVVELGEGDVGCYTGQVGKRWRHDPKCRWYELCKPSSGPTEIMRSVAQLQHALEALCGLRALLPWNLFDELTHLHRHHAFITVTRRHNQLHPDDAEVPGVYGVCLGPLAGDYSPLPRNPLEEGQNPLEEAALDVLHDKVAIKVLDDFHIEVRITDAMEPGPVHATWL